jgi:high-affinity iron transporter
MLSTIVITFREMLEIILIISIIMSSIKTLPKKNLYIASGVMAGALASVIIALCINQITSALNGLGQEYLNIIILTSTIAMIAWIVIWMKKHSSELTKKLKTVSIKVLNKDAPLLCISSIVAISVMREGFEIILFLHGLYAVGTSINDIILGSILGGVTGIITGMLLYKGLLKLSPKVLFNTTGFLLLVLAAGMSAQLANYLESTNLITTFSNPLWNSSWLISESSIIGKTLHALIGYNEQPTGLEVIFYFSTITIIYYFARRISS